ncbi:MAG: hypothetical protein KBS77_07735 [Bacteroidales bacterium]|nr:hypothetical protein [Candidatus Colicola faecequi]
MKRVEFKKMARELGYDHFDLGMDCVFAYNHFGGSLAWFQDTRKDFYMHKPKKKKQK